VILDECGHDDSSVNTNASAVWAVTSHCPTCHAPILVRGLDCAVPVVLRACPPACPFCPFPREGPELDRSAGRDLGASPSVHPGGPDGTQGAGGPNGSGVTVTFVGDEVHLHPAADTWHDVGIDRLCRCGPQVIASDGCGCVVVHELRH